MFSRKGRAERTAADAWDYLSSAMAAASGTAREAGKQTADKASTFAGKAGDFADRAGKKRQRLSKKGHKLAAKADKKGHQLAGRASGSADEAWSRANAAAAALAGRKPGRPWGLITGFALLGIAVGWAAATSARAAVERDAEAEELELADTAIVVTPARES